MGRRFFSAISLLLVFSIFVSSCGQGDGEPGPLKTDYREIRKEYAKGPVRVRLVLDKDSITVAEDLRLTIEADAVEEYTVELPRMSEKLGDFSIVDNSQDTPKLSKEGKILLKNVWTLEPFLSGDYAIPPLKVAFYKKSARMDDHDPLEKEEIETEGIEIKVLSVLAEKGGESRLNPIFGPVELPHSPMGLAFAFAAAAVVLVCGGAAFVWLRKRKKREALPAPALPAHEIAFQALQAILEENLVEKGFFKLFYSRVSDVLRHYIENRFALHASTLTTQEFLATIGRNSAFPPEHRILLDEFLVHCDLVKFAELQPTQVEIRKTLNAFTHFVEATKTERVEPVGVGTAA